MNTTAWTATVWGSGGGANAERLVLPKGEESCHICMEAQVEVAMKPCTHEICLECCNRLRAANIFKVDAGIRCPLCRDYVELFTDLNGNASSVASLRAANDAASKSLATRRSGADASVSTAVPDPTRLVPTGAAARPEPQWVCDKCQHINTGNKEACVRCRCANPGYTRPPPTTALDALKCPPDSVVPLLCEKGHASLKRALAEAGTPLVNGAIAGTPGSIREAVARRGHERLCRIVALLVDGRADRLVTAARDTLGNYGIQRVMEAAVKLRAQASVASQEAGGSRPTEDFGSSLPSSAAPTITAATAYTRIVKAITDRAATLAADQFGVHVVVRAAVLSMPEEVLALARTMVALLPDLTPHGTISKESSLFICNVVARVLNMCFENDPSAPAAADALNALLAAYRHNYRILNAHARHPHLGGALADAVSGALPRAEAFRACHMLACNALWVSRQRNGTNTLVSIISLQSDDSVGRKMIRDLAAVTALALQGQLADVAASVGTDGPQLAQTLLEVLSREREDAWVSVIATELAGAAARLVQQDASLEALLAALARPEIEDDAVEELMDGMEGAGVDMRAIRGEIRARRATAPAPALPFFPDRSEVQPGMELEVARKRLPKYVWELFLREQGGRTVGINGGSAAHHQRHQHGRYNGSAGHEEAYNNSGFGAELPPPISVPSAAGWQFDAPAPVVPPPPGLLPHEMPGYTHQGVPQQQHAYGYQPQQQQPPVPLPSYAQPQPQQPMPSPPPGFAQSPPAYAPPSYAAPQPQRRAYNPVAQQAQQAQHGHAQETSGDLDPSAFFPTPAPAPATLAPYGTSPGSANGGYSDLHDMIQRLTTGDAPVSTPPPPPGFHLPVNQPTAQTSVRPHVLMSFSTNATAANSAAPGSPQWAPPSASSAAVSSPPRPVQYVSASTTPAVAPLGIGGGSSAAVSPLPAASAAAAAAPVVSSHWTCPACTYLHVGKEADYLVCAVCDMQRPQADGAGPF